jgi:hypothetical protein
MAEIFKFNFLPDIEHTLLSARYSMSYLVRGNAENTFPNAGEPINSRDIYYKKNAAINFAILPLR